MADLRGFDAAQVEPSSDFEPLPAGKYLAIITASEMKANKANTGRYLELTFQIADGPYKGRNLWARLNLDHPNATAVRIARAELSAICRAVGVLAPKDSCELHNLPLVIRVACKQRDTGEILNVVKGYTKKNVPTPQTEELQAARPAVPPWRR